MESSSNSDSDSGTSSDTSSEGISSSDSDDLEEDEEEDQSIEESEDDDSDSETEAQQKSNNQVLLHGVSDPKAEGQKATEKAQEKEFTSHYLFCLNPRLTHHSNPSRSSLRFCHSSFHLFSKALRQRRNL